MFEEFFLPAYKKIYKRYRDNGVELIVHHSDSYAATLVPYMIEMGVDIWQGVMTTNNVPELIQKIRRTDFLHGRHRQRQSGLSGLDQRCDQKRSAPRL